MPVNIFYMKCSQCEYCSHKQIYTNEHLDQILTCDRIPEVPAHPIRYNTSKNDLECRHRRIKSGTEFYIRNIWGNPTEKSFYSKCEEKTIEDIMYEIKENNTESFNEVIGLLGKDDYDDNSLNTFIDEAGCF